MDGGQRERYGGEGGGKREREREREREEKRTRRWTVSTKGCRDEGKR